MLALADRNTALLHAIENGPVPRHLQEAETSGQRQKEFSILAGNALSRFSECKNAVELTYL